MSNPENIEPRSLLKSYKRLAIDWDASQSDAKRANSLFDDIHALAIRLRASTDGRAGIETLFQHPNRGVRLKSAADSLQWNSPQAIKTLEDLSSRHLLLIQRRILATEGQQLCMRPALHDRPGHHDEDDVGGEHRR